MIDPNVLKNTLANPEFDGLYSLKALSVSTGDYESNKPYDFLRQPRLKEYLHKSLVLNILTTRKTQGRNGDTFVNKQLVYRYAMWVSDEFYDLVISVFDAMLHGQTQKAESIIKIYTGHEADHEDSLAAKLNLPKAKIKPYFDILRGAEIVVGKPRHQADRMIYDRGRNQGEHIKGKHGDTLLFNDSIIDVFPKQTIWM